ncbi:MAG: HEPN domain-containing protein [Actinobacteria bacterium]|nr:HEPN domain-containing protein [Actinomycetota bacterium]
MGEDSHCDGTNEQGVKALTSRQGNEVPRSHDLRRYVDVLDPVAPELARMADAADRPARYALEVRYRDPAVPWTPDDAKAAVTIARRFGDLILASLRA